MLKGPYIAGSNVLPANLDVYHPWVFSWPEKEKEVCFFPFNSLYISLLIFIILFANSCDIPQIQKLKDSYNRTGKASTLLALRSYTDEVRNFLL